MTDRYLDSVTGLDADTGLSWLLAKATFSNGLSNSVAGDRLFVSPNHNEVLPATVTAVFPGTNLNPFRLIAADTTANPPTAAASGAVIAGAATNLALTLNGNLYAKGITFRPGSTGNSVLSANMTPGCEQFYEDCNLELASTTTFARILIGIANTSAASRTTFKNCRLKFVGIGQYLTLTHVIRFHGGGLTPDSFALASLISGNGPGTTDTVFESFDMSMMSAGFNLVAATSKQSGSIVFRNCKFPDGWVGGLFASQPEFSGLRVSVFNGRLGNGTGKILAIAQDGFGICRNIATVYRHDGAVSDNSPYSLRMASVSGLAFPSAGFEGLDCTTYNDSVGAPVTRYLEIVHDAQGNGNGGRLLDNEFGVRVAFPGGTEYIMRPDILSAGVTIGDSSATWETGSMSAPIKQRVAVTFTPTDKGEVVITPILFSSNKQVYYCPELEV